MAERTVLLDARFASARLSRHDGPATAAPYASVAPSSPRRNTTGRLGVQRRERRIERRDCGQFRGRGGSPHSGPPQSLSLPHCDPPGT